MLLCRKQSFTARELRSKGRRLAGEVKTSTLLYAQGCTFPIVPLALLILRAKLEEAWRGFTSAAVPEHLFRHRQERSWTSYSLNLTPRLTVTHSACFKEACAGDSFTSSTFEGKNKESPTEQVNEGMK